MVLRRTAQTNDMAQGNGSKSASMNLHQNQPCVVPVVLMTSAWLTMSAPGYFRSRAEIASSVGTNTSSSISQTCS